jgi:hypothetical protein
VFGDDARWLNQPPKDLEQDLEEISGNDSAISEQNAANVLLSTFSLLKCQ